MKLYFLLIYILALPMHSDHDVPLATFTVVMDQQPWGVTMKIDSEDLGLALKQTNPGMGETVAYLQEHTSWIVDGKSAALELCSISFEGHHCVVRGELHSPNDTPQQIILINTCLLEVEADQTNVVYLDQAGKSRGFRLHASRRQTVVTL